MPLKPIIDIDVSDEKFKAFADLFKKYREALDKTPAAWKSVGAEMKNAGNEAKAILSALLAQSELQRHVTEEQRRSNTAVREAGFHWQGLLRSTAGVAGNILRATEALAKWAAIRGTVGGLIGGAGSVWGLDRLARVASGGRRSAMGLGISYGQQRAFGLDFGRFVDSDSVLGNVQHGLTDITSDQYRALMTAGVSPRGNAADVAVSLLNKLPQLLGGVPREMRGSMAHAYGLDSVFSMEEINRYLAASAEERAEQRRQYRGDVGAFGLSGEDLKKWQDFETQLKRAGTVIESALIKKLAPLAGPLTDLSKSVGDVVAAFLGRPGLAKWIEDASGALEKFAVYVGGDKFNDKVNSFIDGVGKMGDEIAEVLKFLGIIPRSAGDEQRWGPNGYTGPDGNWLGPRGLGIEFGVPNDPGGIQPPDTSPPASSGSKPAPSSHGGFKGHATKSVYRFFTGPGGGGHHRGPQDDGRFSSIEATYGLPKGLLWNIYGAELSYGRNTRTSSAGAQGPFQFMPATARRFGLTNPQNTQAAGTAAGKYFAKLLAEFHGDVAKAVASYNWGEGNVERDVRRHGADWQRYLPRETSHYLEKVLPGLGAQRSGATAAPKQPLPAKHPRITIENNTGGSAIITSNLLAT